MLTPFRAKNSNKAQEVHSRRLWIDFYRAQNHKIVSIQFFGEMNGSGRCIIFTLTMERTNT